MSAIGNLAASLDYCRRRRSDCMRAARLFRSLGSLVNAREAVAEARMYHRNATGMQWSLSRVPVPANRNVAR